MKKSRPTRRLVSPVTTTSDPRAWSGAVSAAMATVAKQMGSAPVDSVTIALKGTPPTVTVYVGKPHGTGCTAAKRSAMAASSSRCSGP